MPILHAPIVMRWVGIGGKPSEDVASTKFSTPVLVLPDGTAIHDSRLIMRWADEHGCEIDGKAPDDPTRLYPDGPASEEIQSIEQRLHDRMGRFARTYGYWKLRDDQLFSRVVVQGRIPEWQRWLGRVFYPVIRFMIYQGLRINAKSAALMTPKLEEEMEWVSSLLKDRPFLAGEQFTAADVTFASLVSPALCITSEEGNETGNYPPLSALREEDRAEVLALRATPAGKHALRMFREFRPKSSRTGWSQSWDVGLVVVSLLGLCLYGLLSVIMALVQ
jgi:glutathione S-transferase